MKERKCQLTEASSIRDALFISHRLLCPIDLAQHLQKGEGRKREEIGNLIGSMQHQCSLRFWLLEEATEKVRRIRRKGVYRERGGGGVSVRGLWCGLRGSSWAVVQYLVEIEL